MVNGPGLGRAHRALLISRQTVLRRPSQLPSSRLRHAADVLHALQGGHSCRRGVHAVDALDLHLRLGLARFADAVTVAIPLVGIHVQHAVVGDIDDAVGVKIAAGIGEIDGTVTVVVEPVRTCLRKGGVLRH